MPVSYTHLDVYKRQSLICPIKEMDTVITDWGAPIQFVEQLRLKGVRVICGNEPVNYWKDTVV